MANTINGKSLEQVLEELSAPADFEKSTLFDKWEFFEIGHYEDRLNSVVGQSHYVSRFTEPQIVNLPLGQVVFVQNCEISFIADDGTVVYRAGGTGSFELKKSESGDKFISLNNSGYFSQVAAFKSACRNLQMFSIHDIESKSEKKKKTKPVTSVKTNKDSEKKEVVNESFYTEGPMEIIRHDKDNKPVYKLRAHIFVGSEMKSELSTILFYPNQYKGCEKKINDLYTLCAEKGMKVQASLSSANNENTFVFKGFWR